MSEGSGADPEQLERDGAGFAQQAVACDHAGQNETAVFYYTEAAEALRNAIFAGSKMPGITAKVNEYISRAEQLKSNPQTVQQANEPSKSSHQLELERANFLIRQAFEADGSQDRKEAIQLYTEAVELCLKIRDSTKDQALQTKVKKLAMQALDRAEAIKKELAPTAAVQNKPASQQLPTNKPVNAAGKVVPPLGFGAFDSDDDDEGQRARAPAAALAGTQRVAGGGGGGGGGSTVNVGPGGYTKEEIDVLRKTSDINGRVYVPFLSTDVREKFAFPVPFTDKDGKLALSAKQIQQISKWVRPEDFCDSPQMIYAVSSFSIRQTVVSDCSFVASLAISAQYERRFKRKLITSIIYPQNRAGEPVYNPCGKYMVKLNLNGVPRKVIVDDYLPMSQYKELLCSYSNNKSELWVSILEKAYMKVMGGYDFPGSNSNIDLHALTGWIPERISITRDSDQDDRFDKDKEFKRILERFHLGHCLVTVATGDIPETDADRAGLVPTHAYAMLDIREVKGKKLWMLKNPWNHLRWKGRYSERDEGNWTPELQKAVNYDPKSAQTFDNGVFWIDYESLIHFYDVIYINWNPELFKFTTCIHSSWEAKEGPKKDRYNISDNPQYRLELKSGQPSAVWCLLTRHITDKADFANNKEFIALLVYDTGGKKIFYPHDPPPYKDGVRINSPHYLCKLVENKKNATYTLVVSQYEKNNTIHYTLRVYATCDFSLTKIVDPYKKQYEKRFTGQWKGVTAGGCGNYPETHKNNPIYQVKMDNNSTDNYLLVEVFGPKEYSVGFEVIAVSPNVPNSFTKLTSGDFRRGYTVLQLDRIAGGVYNISPCTFKPGEEGPFFLDINSSTPFTVNQLR
ncbi:calpain-7-like [Mya arenaria]|uniref:calpain-7-like n=1 Tax=Mya arenaria TaxID=6604 RepID=UPI0022E2DABC|nr:calpain-7-like [Mya arenaria]XP_052813547.1 calpain-7-like [Mya arenaria]XP_052813548.1 calpain-7-like [Mya arenaria]